MYLLKEIKMDVSGKNFSNYAYVIEDVITE